MEDQNNKIKQTDRNIPNRLKELLIIIGPFILVLFLGSYYASYKQNQQLTNEFKTVLTGQKGSSQYSEVLNQMFSYYKNQSTLQFPYSHKLENTNMLEAKSFASRDSVNQISETLKNTLTELDSSDVKMNGVIQGARLIIQNSNLSQSEKDEMLSGFDKSFQDQESKRLSSKRITAMRNFYEKVLTLYEFMSANFADYQIQNDSSGTAQVSFYSDSNIARYNQIFADVQKLAVEFQNASSDFTTYNDKSFKSGGVNINSTDVQNYFNGQ
jgi:hypothetical protein